MEKASEMVPFPLLPTPIESNYRACTIPYRFPSDNPRKPTPTEIAWIDLFLNSVPSFKKRAESDPTVPDAAVRAEKFAQRYFEILEDFKKDPESHGGPPDCILLCRIREQILRELGFRDIFKKVKEEENAKAISLFADVVLLNDAIEDGGKRIENLVRGIFAGNIFDLGSAQLAEIFSKDGMSFLASCQNLVPRPWVIDDLDTFKLKWSKKSWKKAIIFVDNSGADIILGILPFARELLRRGTQAFRTAWKKACESSGSVNLLIPKGTYLIGHIEFTGPCNNVSSLTVHLKGYLKATTDLSKYGFSAGWVEFGWVEGLTLTGGGTLDGQGAKAWPYNDCPTDSNCKLLPTNVKFMAMNKTVVRGITSLNSKFFHIALVECKNFKGSKIKISAPSNSPNTDGIHIERSSSVYFSGSHIGTGDDCISVGQGNSQVTITGVTCGPGHGISVGSLGRYRNEGDVSGLLVRDCTMTGTTNGIRIKTWENSPGSSAVTNMTFENIVMNNVTNPIIIDQTYCPFTSCTSMAPSRVKISDIYFKNIRGTSSSKVAVALECSKGMPCQNIYLENVHLDLSSGEKHATSTCKNVRAKYIGTQLPPPCS